MNKILILTNKEDITVDFVIDKLIESNAEYFRFNTEEIGSELTLKISSDNFNILITDNKKNEQIDISSFDSVYYRRPKLPPVPNNLSTGEKYFVSQELTVILDYISLSLDNKLWLNRISDIKKAENKINQQRVAKDIGFKIPISGITNVPSIAKNFISSQSKTIIKPLKIGLIEENEINSKIVYTNEINQHFVDNIDRVSALPVYLQQKIEKQADIRVTIVGKNIYAALIDSQSNEISRTDWRAAQEILPHTKIELPQYLQEYCLNLTAYFNLNFAAIDLVLDKDNKYYFLEINPNGQWAWIEQILKYPISQSIAEYLIGN